MLEFKKPTVADKARVEACAAVYNERLCEHCFADLFIWQGHYNTEICFWKDMMFVRMRSRVDGSVGYLAPVGGGDVAEAVMLLEQDAAALGVPFVMYSASEGGKARLEEALPGRFVFSTDEGDWDYLYLREKMETLSGSKLQAKRNLVNRFLAAHEGRWSYEDITAENKEEAYAFHLKWGEENPQMCQGDFKGETCAIRLALDHFEALGMKGGLLRLDGEVIAFTLGCRSGVDTFVVQIEKADHTIDGAYQVINREFVRRNCGEVTYINREEDLGLEGLRHAKRSYKPVMMGVKYTAVPAAKE